MKKLIFPLFPALVFFTTSAIAADTGYIQVKAPPGITIFLDGNFKGKTTAGLGGIILEDVPAGRHVIKAVKSGFTPKQATLRVNADAVVSWTVGSFTPMIKVRETGDPKPPYQPVGSLVVKSVPIELSISIPALGVSYNKRKEKATFSEVPAGKYAVSFSGLGKKIESRVAIYDRDDTELFVNLLKGEIQNKTVGREGAIDDKKLQRRGGKYYAPNQGTPYTGWAKSMHDNGRIRWLFQYKDGKLDGLSTMWFPNGQKKAENTWKDGEILTAVAWKPNGKKCPETKVVNGNGIWVYYSNNGSEVGRATFKDGELVRD